MTPTDLDHVGFAVNDASRTLRDLYQRGVLLPVAGEEDEGFRYVIGGRQIRDRGIRIELLDPNLSRDSFLAHYLQEHGEGAHHITFMVDDLDATLAALHRADIAVTRVDLSYPPWREAFIHPCSGLGTVVQIASSVHTYPFGCDHHHTVDATDMPHRQTGHNRYWWRQALGYTTEPAAAKTVTAVELGVAGSAVARTVFSSVLGGRETISTRTGATSYVWPSGTIEVTTATPPQVTRLNIDGFENDVSRPGFALGRTRFVGGDPG